MGLGEICSCIDACSPRVLFIFKTCSVDIFTDDQVQTDGGFRPPPSQQVN